LGGLGMNYLLWVVDDDELATAWAVVHAPGGSILIVRRGDDCPALRREAEGFMENSAVVLSA